MAFEELFDAFDDVGRVVSACRRVTFVNNKKTKPVVRKKHVEREREREPLGYLERGTYLPLPNHLP